MECCVLLVGSSSYNYIMKPANFSNSNLQGNGFYIVRKDIRAARYPCVMDTAH